MVGRGALGGDVRRYGLVLSDLDGRRAEVAAARLRYEAGAAALADRDVVLVTVKSLATAEAGRALAAVLRRDAIVVSLQNGVGNADVLRGEVGGRVVLAGMVPFNVLRTPPTGFHRATAGAIELERGADGLVAALRRAGLAVEEHADLRPVLWAKLVLNLNNALNALAGVPLVEELGDPGYRRVLSAMQREALAALRAAGLRPARLGKVGPRMVPWLLRLPTPLFRRVAAGMLAIDPTARSSMWEDLERRRATEIDFLNGAVVALADRHGVAAPVNRAVIGLVRRAEAAAAGSPRMSAAALAAALSAAAARP
jgi:2-dehydropantoate 2-reductase